MRALDVILGLGAVGATVLAARAIASALSRPAGMATLPPQATLGANVKPVVDRGPASPINTGREETVQTYDGSCPSGYVRTSDTQCTKAVASFNPAVDCVDAMSTSPACWCWGEGFGRPECVDFDYTVFSSGPR